MNKIGALLPALLVAVAPGAQAAFQNMPQSVKEQGMGGAFVALADDATSLFANPAGLSNLKNPEASLMYGSPLAGVEGVNLRQGYFAMGSPLLSNVSIGVGGNMFQASGLLSEYTGVAGVSARVGKSIAVGATANYFQHTYDIGRDPSYAQEGVFSNGLSKSAVGLDFGAIAYARPNLQFGVSLRNANRPDVGLSQPDPIGREVRIGSVYKSSFGSFLLEFKQHELVGDTAQNTWHIGMEAPFKAVSVRAGMNADAVTAGLGLQLGPMRLDYAFAMLRQVQASNYGNQVLSLSFALGSGSDDAKAKRRKQDNEDFKDGFFGIR